VGCLSVGGLLLPAVFETRLESATRYWGWARIKLKGDTMVETKLVTVTPAMARHWLDACNTKNRPIRSSVVDRFVREITSGAFQLTHQGIAFDEAGVLLDGQHRLMATVQAGMSVEMMVTTGLPAKSQVAMDDGTRRNFADALRLSGSDGITRQHVGTLAFLWQYANNQWCSPTRNELANMYEVFREPLNELSVLYASSKRGVGSAPVTAAISVAWFYVPVKADGTWRRFIAVLNEGGAITDMAEESAIHLRDQLTSGEIASNSRADRVAAFCQTQRAVLAFMRGERLKRFKKTHTYFRWPLDESLMQKMASAARALDLTRKRD
jgi:hypothetical protein